MKTEAKDILDTVQVGALATVNANRTPLVTPLHFARWNDYIVWVSDRAARHSGNVFRSGRAEFTVWDAKKRAVYLTTSVTEVLGSEAKSALAAYAKKLGSFIPKSANMQVYAAKIGQLDQAACTTNTWHFVA